VYRHVIKLPSFLAVPEDAALLDLIGKIVDGPALLHRLRIGRITFPNNVAQTTAVHQDHWYIRGTPETYTIWAPLGDCPVAPGGLAVLPGSHRHGFIEHRLHPEKKYAGHGLAEEQLPRAGAGAGTGTADGDARWVAGDFELGD